MVERSTVCLRRLAAGEADEARFRRWLGNPQVTVAELRDACGQRLAALGDGRHLLAIQDTSEINFQRHAGKTRGLGPVGNGRDRGLFVHPVIAVTADEGTCLGLADVQVWTRPAGGWAGNRRQRALADKESGRWLDGAQAAERVLARAARVTVVQDREGDLYPLLARPRPPGRHFLVRAAQDRALAGAGRLFATLDGWPVAASLTVALPARAAQKGVVKGNRPARPARPATLAVRFGRVTLKRPGGLPAAAAPAGVTVTVVDVREVAPPAGTEPVHWRLLTSHEVATPEQACAVVGWYQQRWHVEQIFRTLKTQGLDLEASQVESAEALLKLTVVATQAATRIMQLVLGRDGAPDLSARLAFTPAEVRVLEALLPTVQGRTVKQQNPHRPRSLAWAAWIIARLGGWTGYATRTPPGPITMHHGLQRFTALCAGYLLAHEGQNRPPAKQDVSVD